MISESAMVGLTCWTRELRFVPLQQRLRAVPRELEMLASVVAGTPVDQRCMARPAMRCGGLQHAGGRGERCEALGKL